MPDKNQLQELPDELRRSPDADPLLATVFNQLAPCRQKEYANYLAKAKQVATREKWLKNAFCP